MKHLWELTEEDFNKHPVWYFPITVSSSSVYGLEKIEKEIEGYYFINKAGDVEVKHVTS